MTTEIPSPGWVFGSLGMIHLASPSDPAALWRAFSPGKLNIWCHALGSWWSPSLALLWRFGRLRCCTVTPAKGWCSAHLPRARGPSPGASSQTLPFACWCHKVKGTDGVSVEFLLVLRMLQPAGQALPEGYGCLAVVLLSSARVCVRKHTRADEHQNDAVFKEVSLRKLHFGEWDQGCSHHILQHPEKAKGVNC